MNLTDAAKLALIYRRIKPDAYQVYAKILDTLSASFDLNDAKSIRFEKDPRKLAAVRNKSSIHTTMPNPTDKNDTVDIVCYAFTMKNKDGKEIEEDGQRYMFCSEKFMDTFSVRFFSTEGKFNQFKSNHMITVTDEFDFRGAKMALYKSKDSEVERVAIFCAKDCDLTPDVFAKEYKYTAVILPSVAKTSIFSA